MNSVVLIGRIVREVDLRFIPSSGMAVCKMSLAVDKGLYGEKKQEAINQGKPTVDFINITVFGKIAENCANYLAKGSQCGVLGRITTGSYTAKDGTKRYTTDVIADKVEFLGSKADRQAQSGNDFMPSDDEDIFEPVEDEDIPW